MKRERNAKQAFIEGTVRVVARDGLDKTTTKAIATEAGLSEAYIYRCFESKEALLCAAFHMEDVAFAYFLKQNLVGMHIQNAPWKDRAFQLWSASWRFILGRKDDCLFYLRYYYSANCRTYAYEEHLLRGASPMFSGAICSGGTNFQTGSQCQHATSSGF